MTRYISEAELRAWKTNLEYFTIIEPKFNSIDADIRDNILANKEIETILSFQEAIVKIPGVLNTEYRPVFALENNKIEKLLSITNSKLIEGDLPKKDTRDLLLTQDIMKYKNLTVGDYIGKSINKDEYLWGRFKITGVISSELSLGIASLKYFKRKTNVNKNNYIVFAKNNITSIDKFLENANNYNIRDLSNLIKTHNEKYKDLKRLIFVIVIVLISSLIIISSLFMILYLKERQKEFAIYFANGIKIKDIIIFELKELSIMIILSIILGISFSRVFLLFLREILFKKGVFLATLSFQEYLLIMPIAISIFITVFIVLKIKLKANKLEKIILGDY